MGLKLSEYMQREPYLAEILRELPQELVQTILIRTYCAGDVIVQRCEEGMDVYIVLEGVCCATCNFVNGERSWFRKKTVGDVFGLQSLGEQRHPFSATIFAKTRCVLAMIPNQTMLQCFGKYPNFTMELTMRVLNRLNFELWRLSECNTYPPYIGVITYLIYAYEFYARSYPAGYEGPVRIIETQKEIAHYICMNVRSLQRVLPTIRDEKLIDLRYGNMSITKEQYERMKKRKLEYFQ